VFNDPLISLLTAEVIDAPFLNQGVEVTVVGPDRHGQLHIQLDGKKPDYALAPGSYILTDPAVSSTVQVITGLATATYVFLGNTVVAVIESGETATIAETLDNSGTLIGISVTADAGVVSVNGIAVEPGQTLALPVAATIDIKPGGTPNSINLSAKGVIPVAVLGSATFDATAIDASSLLFEGDAARVKGKSGNIGSQTDVNGDGWLDVVVQISLTEATTFTETSTQGCLTGRTTTGLVFRGCDEVRIVPR
jgi:hypothetical protein